jgi:hypothetical protein
MERSKAMVWCDDKLCSGGRWDDASVPSEPGAGSRGSGGGFLWGLRRDFDGDRGWVGWFSSGQA